MLIGVWLIHLFKCRDDGKQKQQKLYGIHYDDDYDYLQHLRSVDYSSAGLELVPNHVSLNRIVQ